MGVSRVLGAVVLALGIAVAAPAWADEPEFVIVIKDHQFSPAEVQVPAGAKLKLRIRNQDATPEEFESHSLHREKLVAGGQEILVLVGPLKPGTYEFFGDFHQKTAQGKLVAK